MSTFLAIDFETANYASDSACAIGLVRAENGVIVAEEARLIQPPTPEFYFTHIHGLTWLDVKDEPVFQALWPEIAPFFDGIDFLAAHNSGFDSKVLKSCCDTYGLNAPETEFVCTVKLARSMWEIRPTKLPNVAHFLGLDLDHHDALSDSRACANIILAAERDGWGYDTGFENVGERYTAPE
ncbi:3'-5' exonuclease [Sneathiella chinensis]|uniref:Exonuclease n=1 Tax=Sneathiella chinensis TaxID=349750 RepID=A0ABQ5U2T7_9PROT|nr:3'-5' exonuclease [Sneathiella chinensis]GLQ05500.1 exonuclease [Sneathiella chinensis]